MTYSALNNFLKGLVLRFAPNLTRRTLEVERPVLCTRQPQSHVVSTSWVLLPMMPYN